MKAAIVTEQGLALRDIPIPTPGPEQILVKLRAIGLNRADLGVAAGHAHGAVGGIGAIPGLEAAGEVVECGPGVPDHLKPHLFDPFVTTKRRGTGLGLALVAKIVRDHGGVIECESEPKRTIFRVLLPMQDRTAKSKS